MIKSMTAFGRAKRTGEKRDITVEVKSVNSRFLDVSVRLPRAYSHLEEKIKAEVGKFISRGKVDLTVTVDSHGAEAGLPTLHPEVAKAYLEALFTLRDTFSLPDDITAVNVARLPDVITARPAEEDEEELLTELLPALDEALRGHLAMRTAEGEKAERDLKAKVETVRALVDKIEERSLADISGYHDKLEARLRQVLSDGKVTVDENRILTECAIFADKVAIDEELVRLRSHFGAFYEISALKEPSGRKLDFLMQEMNRETNTIGSKANDAAIARLVVDVKGELEKMREQIQNVE